MTHNATAPRGEIHGTGVVRDKDGNIKYHFEFGGPATAQEAAELQKLFKPENPKETN